MSSYPTKELATAAAENVRSSVFESFGGAWVSSVYEKNGEWDYTVDLVEEGRSTELQIYASGSGKFTVAILAAEYHECVEMESPLEAVTQALGNLTAEIHRLRTAECVNESELHEVKHVLARFQQALALPA